MSRPPSFSSYLPDISSSQQQAEASSSRLVPAPSFSSFPDLTSSSSGGNQERQAPTSSQSKRRTYDTYRDHQRASADATHSKRTRDGKRGIKRESRLPSDSIEDEDSKAQQVTGYDRAEKENRRRKERDRALGLAEGRLLPDEESRIDETLVENRDDGQRWYENTRRPGDLGASYEVPSGKSWFEDWAGDPEVRKFGQSSSYNAPRYHRNGGGRVFGLSDGLRIVLSNKERTHRGLEIAPLGRPFVPRYSFKAIDGSSERHIQRILLRPGDGSSDILVDDFTAFNQQRRSAPVSDVPQYRDIAPLEDASDDDEELAALGTFSTLDDNIRAQTTDAERHLQSNPSDVDAWISYSTLHLRASPGGTSEKANGSVDPSQLPTTRANAEITLSILSRGLEASPDNSLSPKLHLAYLRAAEEFWPPAKVTARWQNVLRQLGQGEAARAGEEKMMELWLGYIAWREGQGFGKTDEREGAVGGVDEVVEVFLDCFRQISTQTISYRRQSREENQVYLFLRACLFLKQAGYTERAAAAFQALMDITFFKPDHLRVRVEDASPAWFDHVVQEYEKFWDSEMPRFGDPGSFGWKFQGDKSTTVGEDGVVEGPRMHATDPFERWREAEEHAERIYKRPGRATDLDNNDDDDPFRVILFADVEPLMFPVQTSEGRLQLVHAYFNFLGLVLGPPEVSTLSPARTDPRLWWGLAENADLLAAFWPERRQAKVLTWQTVGGEPMEPERGRPLTTPFTSPVKCYVHDLSIMFSRDDKWFREVSELDLRTVDFDLVKRTLSLLGSETKDPFFSLLMFVINGCTSSKIAIKAAKSTLSNDRDNSILWDGYARLERQRGNVKAARAVYLAAIQAAHSLRGDAAPNEDEWELWSSWAEMEWECNEEVRALSVLIMAVGVSIEGLANLSDPNYEPSRPSSIEILKAKQEYSVSPLLFERSRVVLSALFTYLTRGINATQDILLQHIRRLPPGSAQAEDAFQLLTKILFEHSSRYPGPASLMRDVLELAIASFPNNTSFLSLYIWSESRGSIYGRVQKLIAKITDAADGSGVVGHLWSVWAEGVLAHRTFWDRGGTGAERVRSCLDRGINSASGKQCAALWRLYIEFETLMGRYNIAKQLCYRALAAMGGCKLLYMIPFGPLLRPHFRPRELKEWAQLIVERGIRIRVPFETFWSDDNEGEEEMTVLPDDEQLAEDELEFLRERQTMKPY